MAKYGTKIHINTNIPLKIKLNYDWTHMNLINKFNKISELELY